MPKVGTQTVLLNLPANFHNEELVHVLQQFVNKEADIHGTSGGEGLPRAAKSLGSSCPSSREETSRRSDNPAESQCNRQRLP